MTPPERARPEIGDEGDRDPRWTILRAEADLTVEPGRELEGWENTPSVLQVLLQTPDRLAARVLVVNSVGHELMNREALGLAAWVARDPGRKPLCGVAGDAWAEAAAGVPSCCAPGAIRRKSRLSHSQAR
jgi:hypothetical protein